MNRFLAYLSAFVCGMGIPLLVALVFLQGSGWFQHSVTIIIVLVGVVDIVAVIVGSINYRKLPRVR